MHAIHCNVSVVTASDPKNDGKVMINLVHRTRTSACPNSGTQIWQDIIAPNFNEQYLLDAAIDYTRLIWVSFHFL